MSPSTGEMHTPQSLSLQRREEEKYVHEEVYGSTGGADQKDTSPPSLGFRV